MAFGTMVLLGGYQVLCSDLGNGVRYGDSPNAGDGKAGTD